ncbi:MAG: hypothetical protein ABIL77_00575, partial [candidate division WOR-3 bacterium]
MRKYIILIALVANVAAQGFVGTYADHPIPIDSNQPTIRVSTFGAFRLVDDYFTSSLYPAILPPWGISLSFTNRKLFANAGYARNRGFELSFHHIIYERPNIYVLWGANGLILPDIESEHTFYVSED